MCSSSIHALLIGESLSLLDLRTQVTNHGIVVGLLNSAKSRERKDLFYSVRAQETRGGEELCSVLNSTAYKGSRSSSTVCILANTLTFAATGDCTYVHSTTFFSPAAAASSLSVNTAAAYA